MWNIPTAERLSTIPRLYETDHIPLGDKLVYLHFFIFGCDWFIVEYDGNDLFFGYAILHGDQQNAEWGYMSFTELRELQVNGIEVDCELDCYWTIKQAREIKQIKIYED